MEKFNVDVQVIDFEKEIAKIESSFKSKEVLTERFEDYNEAYEKSMEDGTGFEIDETIDYSKYFAKDSLLDIQDMVFENSIFSYKFGIALEDEEKVISKLYQCDCGLTTGIENLGHKCPHCRTEVTRMKPMSVGWFVLKNHKIIHPFILFMIHKERSPIKPMTKRQEKLLSEKLKAKELEKEKEELKNQNIDDNMEDVEDEEQETTREEKKEEKKKKNPYVNEKISKAFLTLEEALNQKKLPDFKWDDLFEEDGVKLEAFIKKYLKRHEVLLNKYRHLWYVNKLPVLSKNYRYFSIQNIEVTDTNRINMHSLNSAYMTISGLVNALNGDVLNNSTSWVNDHKKALAAKLGYVGKLIFADIGSSKKSYIRGEVYGKKYSFSGRLVVEPINDRSSYEIDICELPLEYFRSTFVTDIVKIGVELKIDIKRLHNITDIDYKITKEDKKLLLEEIFPRVKDPVVYVNREPDIYVTSILALRVAKITDEMVIRIPFSILVSMVCDFDLIYQGKTIFMVEIKCGELLERP